MWAVSETWTGLGSAIASFMFLWIAARPYLPRELQSSANRYTRKLTSLVYPYIHISFPEYVGQRLKRSDAYTFIEAYLGTTCTDSAKRLKGEMGKESSALVLSMDEYEEVVDDFKGVKVWWSSSKKTNTTQTISFYPPPDGNRFYQLVFHRRHRKVVTEGYLAHVVEQGKAIVVRKRQRKLFTNNPNIDWYDNRRGLWSHVAFEHPASFDTIAMDSKKKQDIVEDLTTFRESKEYYSKIGKPWKRGYLLYGPPGTGKSTMIAAMANFLDYDVYDLELTGVKNNSMLRKMMIETTGKSIIVIEDVDCSLDLTGKRKRKGGDGKDSDGKEEEKVKEEIEKSKDKDDSKVTLSGLLNFIDGLWSACGGERLIVITTNHIEKLDPALIRRGRMDKHIELSYCTFDAFKVLAKNYLDVDDHPLFPTIRDLIGEAKITPADVAEYLIIKTRSSGGAEVDVNARLDILVEALEKSKKEQEEEEAKKKQKQLEEDAATKKKKAEDEETKKKEVGDKAASEKTEVKDEMAIKKPERESSN